MVVIMIGIKNNINIANNVNTESNNNWKSRLNKRSYPVLVFVIIISLIINFTSPFFTIVSHADYTVSGNHVDYFEPGTYSGIMGTFYAKLGYLLDGYENSQILSNLFTLKGNDMLTDAEMASIVPNYEIGTDEYNCAILNKLVENGQIIVDQNNQNIQLSASMCQLLIDYMNTEVEPDYKLFKIPGYESFRHWFRPWSYFPDKYFPLSSNEIGLYYYYYSAHSNGDISHVCESFYDVFSLSENFFVIPTGQSLNDCYNIYHKYFLRNALVGGQHNNDYINKTLVQVANNKTLTLKTQTFYTFYQFGENINQTTSRNPRNYYDEIKAPGKLSYQLFFAPEDMFVPVFKTKDTFINYIEGHATLYQYDSGYNGGSVTIDPSVDPQEVYNAISEAIKDSGLNDTSAIQELIKNVASEFLKTIASSSVSTSINTAAIAKNTAGILEASKSMLTKLDNIYNELKSFHTDYNKHFKDSIDMNLKKIVSALESGNFGGSYTDSDTLISISGNISDVFSVVINPVSINVVQRGNDLDVQLHDLINHTNNQIVDIDVGFQELVSKHTDKFPICIPSDMLYMYSLFAAKPEAPHFDLPINYKGISEQTIVIDLSGWGTLSKISRGFFSILFIAGLIPLTFKILDYNEKFFERR